MFLILLLPTTWFAAALISASAFRPSVLMKATAMSLSRLVSWARREIRALKRRAYRLLWLNPLLGSADYRPVAQGKSAALPYVDQLLPVHSLDSLARVGRTLIKLARG